LQLTATITRRTKGKAIFIVCPSIRQLTPRARVTGFLSRLDLFAQVLEIVHYDDPITAILYKSCTSIQIVQMATYNTNFLSDISSTDSHIAPIPTTAQSTMAQSAAQIAFRRDSAFLVLAPVLSTDYPTPAPTSTTSTPSTESLAPVPEALPAVKKDRRSSSVSSGDGIFKRRILKLGPVHGGQQDGGSDYVEFEEEE
jgi:hypothetical protein